MQPRSSRRCPRPRCKFPHSGKRGGLNGSVQHLLAVYLPESEIPKFFLEADLSAALPHRARLENVLTSPFVYLTAFIARDHATKSVALNLPFTL
jgi:hypothetical protein